jgi:hypothetical protein
MTMPLATQILRDGDLLKLAWSDFHVACMALASSFEAGDNSFSDPSKVYDTDELRFDCYPDAAFPVTRQLAFMLCTYGMLAKTPLNDRSYTLTRKHKFLDTTDGEILELLPGDILIMQREF